MTVLTASQIKAYAAQAGFSGQALNIITAIALAESGGDTNAVNSSDPNGGSYGLVQINGSHFHTGGTSKQCALDPGCSMQYAYTLWSSQGFEPWGTYDPHNPNVTPAYENFLPQVEQAPQGNVANLTTSTNAYSSSSPGDFLSSLQAIIPWVSDPNRILKMIAGIGLIVISLLFLVVPGLSDKVTPVVKKATGAMEKIGQ